MKYINYHFKSAPHDFFHWCTKHKLHKSSKNAEQTSRLQLIYNQFEPFVGIDAIVALDNDKPVGIITCEHREIKKETSIMENPDLNFINLGFVNIYVKSKYRKQGIASQFVQGMEELRLGLLKEHFSNNDIPYFVAREKAKTIVEAKSLYTYAIGTDIDHRGRQMELDNIAYHKTCKINDANYQPISYPNQTFNLKNELNKNNVREPIYLTQFEDISNNGNAIKMKL